MRPALYWVVKFDDGTYEYRDMIRGMVHKTSEPETALPWLAWHQAIDARDAYRKEGTFRDFNANTLAWLQAQGLLFNAVSVRLEER